MTHRDHRHNRSGFLTLAVIGLATGGLLLSTGCKKKEEKKVERPRVVDEGPKEPQWKPVYSSMDLSPKVEVEIASYDKCSSDQIRATYAFMDAFAKGDAEALHGMLAPDMVPVLNELQQSGEWSSATDDIQSVELIECRGESDDEFKVHFVIYDPKAPELIDQKWKGRARGDTILFSADYTIEKLPEQAQPEVAAGDEEESDQGVSVKGSDPGDNPRDPRKRVPRERDPGAPGNPG